MASWRSALKAGAVSGSVASICSTLMLLARGRAELRKAFAPVNAVSHWIWGDEAFRHDRPRLRYTVTGYAIHHLMSIGWAVVYERLRSSTRQPARVSGQALAVSAAACLVDYTITPARFTPGFETRLSRASLGMVYGAFAAGLAAAAWIGRRQ